MLFSPYLHITTVPNWQVWPKPPSISWRKKFTPSGFATGISFKQDEIDKLNLVCDRYIIQIYWFPRWYWQNKLIFINNLTSAHFVYHPPARRIILRNVGMQTFYFPTRWNWTSKILKSKQQISFSINFKSVSAARCFSQKEVPLVKFKP